MRLGNQAGIFSEGIDDFAIIWAAFPDELEEIRECGPHFGHKRAVAAAAVHEIWRHFAAEFEPGFCDESGQPRDSFHGGTFWGQIFHRGHMSRRAALLDLGEICVPDPLDGQGGFEIGCTPVQEVIDKIKKLLGRAPDGVKKCGVGGRKKGVWGSVTSFPCGDGAGVYGTELGFPV